MNDDEKDMTLTEERALLIERAGEALDRERATIRIKLAPTEALAKRAMLAGQAHEAAGHYAEMARTWREAGFAYLADQYHRMSAAVIKPARRRVRRSA